MSWQNCLSVGKNLKSKAENMFFAEPEFPFGPCLKISGMEPRSTNLSNGFPVFLSNSLGKH
jgi:hypothetical protein